MGRRQFLDPATKRRNSLQCYLNDLEFRTVCRLALKQDKHISAWVRELVLEKVKEGEVQRAQTL